MPTINTDPKNPAEVPKPGIPPEIEPDKPDKEILPPGKDPGINPDIPEELPGKSAPDPEVPIKEPPEKKA